MRCQVKRRDLRSLGQTAFRVSIESALLWVFFVLIALFLNIIYQSNYSISVVQFLVIPFLIIAVAFLSIHFNLYERFGFSSGTWILGVNCVHVLWAQYVVLQLPHNYDGMMLTIVFIFTTLFLKKNVKPYLINFYMIFILAFDAILMWLMNVAIDPDNQLFFIISAIYGFCLAGIHRSNYSLYLISEENKKDINSLNIKLQKSKHRESIQAQEDESKTIALREKTEELEKSYAEMKELRKEIKLKSEEFKKIERQKNRFFQNMSHEIRTPLTLILNPLEQQSKEQPDNSELQVAKKNSRRLLRLVNQLLDFQKIEAGKSGVKISPINFSHFVQVCGAHFAPACKSKKISFKVTVNGEVASDESPTILAMGDINALEKVIFNYLSNALKYTPLDGMIELGIIKKNARVKFFVRDSGPGIVKQYQTKLFQAFSQIDVSASRIHEGTGLGLALVKSLMEDMDGTVGVDSMPGEGSVFWADLASLENPKPATSVLIVADDATMAEKLSTQFQTHFTDEYIAVKSTTEEALSFLEDNAVCCVISDYSLTGESGLELMREVSRRYPRCYRILMTGEANFDLLKRGANENLVDHFFQKTNNNKTFIAELEQAVIKNTPKSASKSQLIKPVVDILIVEDDRNLREYLCDLLVDEFDLEDNEIALKSSVAEALEFLSKFSVRCVLSDYNLGSQNGLYLLEKIARESPETKRVLMTAQADLEVMKKAVNHGEIHHVFYKPVDESDILSNLSRLIRESTIKDQSVNVIDDSFQVKSWILEESGGSAFSNHDSTEDFNIEGEDKDRGSPLVLVVDDLKDMRNLVTKILLDQGYRVVAVSNGEKAIDAATDLAPDLIIIEWMLPQISGPALVDRLQSDEKLLSIPTILLTAKNEDEKRFGSDHVSPSAMLVKPFSESELIAQVSKVLDLKQQEKFIADKKESDIKIQLVRDLADNMNHPMDDILNVQTVMLSQIKDIHQSLKQLWSGDQESKNIKANVEQQLLSLEDNITSVKYSVGRSHDALEEINNLSSIGRVHLNVIKMSVFFGKMRSRLGEIVGENGASRISMDIQGCDEHELVSNHYVLLVAIERMLKAVFSKAGEGIALEISSRSSEEDKMMRIMIEGDYSYGDVFALDDINLLKLLLRPYEVFLNMSMKEAISTIILGVSTDVCLIETQAS